MSFLSRLTYKDYVHFRSVNLASDGQQLTALSISSALVTKLLVIEQLLHPALKSTVSAPWHTFHLCPSSKQILATPLERGDGKRETGKCRTNALSIKNTFPRFPISRFQRPNFLNVFASMNPTSESSGVSRHTTRRTSRVTVVSQCKLESD